MVYALRSRITSQRKDTLRMCHWALGHCTNVLEYAYTNNQLHTYEPPWYPRSVMDREVMWHMAMFNGMVQLSYQIWLARTDFRKVNFGSEGSPTGESGSEFPIWWRASLAVDILRALHRGYGDKRIPWMLVGVKTVKRLPHPWTLQMVQRPLA